MWNKSLLVFLLIFICFKLQAQHKLILHISDTTQREVTLQGGNAAIFQQLDKITENFRKQGYITTAVDSIITGTDSTVAFIDKGSTWTFKSAMLIKGEDGRQEDTSLHKSYETVETQIDSLLKWNRNNGYPFASARSIVKDIRQGNHIHLEIN
ncbi:MAG: hypothetical protein ACOC31_06555, partial [Bacteroidota bacterium]